MTEVHSSASSSTKRPLHIELAENGGFADFGHYMAAKVAKLKHQVHNDINTRTELFKDLSIYVNGYTDPPALELRHMFVENGGEFHHYYEYGKTSYIVATNLAKSKWKSLRKNEIVIKPQWILDCLKQSTIIPTDSYILKPFESPSLQLRGGVAEFYERSRLHLISTLAQDLKTFTAELRANPRHEFKSRQKLTDIAATSNGVVEPTVCHIDMDCFFVSVALRTRPELKGLPVAITHSKDVNGKGFAEIASCSYEARAFKIKAGMWINEARQLCPDLVCVPYEFEEYKDTSKTLYTTVARYTLDIRAISCDEMYLDLTGLCKSMGISDPLEVIKVIRDEIEQVTKCTASAGLGPNMLVARLATKQAKPNGQCHVMQSQVKDFMRDVKIVDLPGVGWSAADKLRSELGNVQTCKELRKLDLARLQDVFGQKQGKKMFDACRGTSEPLQLTELTNRKSFSCDINFGVRLKTESDFHEFLDDIASQLSLKLKNGYSKGRTITLKLLIRAPHAPIEPSKYGAHGECDASCKALTLPEAVDDKVTLLNSAISLAKSLKPEITDIRGIGIQVTKLDCNLQKKEAFRARSPKQPSLLNFLAKRKYLNNTIDLTKEQSQQKHVVPKEEPQPELTVSKQESEAPSLPAEPVTESKPEEPPLKVVVDHLPKPSDFCDCNSDHEVYLDLSRYPDDRELFKMRCKFVRFIKSGEFSELRAEFSEVVRTIYDCDFISSLWIHEITKIQNYLNRTSEDEFNIQVLPDIFIHQILSKKPS